MHKCFSCGSPLVGVKTIEVPVSSGFAQFSQTFAAMSLVYRTHKTEGGTLWVPPGSAHAALV